MHTSVLFHSTGPAFLPSPGCPDLSLFQLSTLNTLPAVLCQLMFGIIAFEGYVTNTKLPVAFVFLAHMFLAGSSTLSELFSCSLSVVAGILICAGTAVYTLRLVKRRMTVMDYKTLELQD
eukprot:TRINITY_DN4348_c0_g1_i2.p1 TRINITY_DN4348_c0_g1~~TRINITY_DN4348_c0_g1_i2.p1  ORF type:complete len:120 (+),score=12.21 TRINITY_DN4348_c0_g1_i2:297-656(+)